MFMKHLRQLEDWVLAGPYTARGVRVMSRRAAYGLVFATYLASYGSGLVGVAKVYGHATLRNQPWWNVATLIAVYAGITTLTVLVSVVATMWLSGKNALASGRRPGESRRSWVGAEGANGAAAICLAVICFRVMGAFGSPDFPFLEHPGPADNALDLTSSAFAGFHEEFLFCLLIPIAVRSAKHPLLWGIALSAMLRALFHTYYGPTTPFLLIWAFLAPLIVLRTGRIWGVVIFHSAFDVVQSWNHIDSSSGGVAVAAFVLVVLAAVISGVPRVHRALNPPPPPEPAASWHRVVAVLLLAGITAPRLVTSRRR